VTRCVRGSRQGCCSRPRPENPSLPFAFPVRPLERHRPPAEVPSRRHHPIRRTSPGVRCRFRALSDSHRRPTQRDSLQFVALRPRPTARVLLITPDDRTLLFRWDRSGDQSSRLVHPRWRTSPRRVAHGCRAAGGSRRSGNRPRRDRSLCLDPAPRPSSNGEPIP